MRLLTSRSGVRASQGAFCWLLKMCALNQILAFFMIMCAQNQMLSDKNLIQETNMCALRFATRLKLGSNRMQDSALWGFGSNSTGTPGTVWDAKHALCSQVSSCSLQGGSKPYAETGWWIGQFHKGVACQKSGHPESNQGPSDFCNALQSDALPTEL